MLKLAPKITTLVLVHKVTKEVVQFPYTTENGRTITGATPPRHENSSGRVYTSPSGEYFPHCFNLQFVERSTLNL
jgi:hypothetical protein